VSALVGVPIEWLCEVHDAKTKMFYRKVCTGHNCSTFIRNTRLIYLLYIMIYITIMSQA